MRRLATGRYAVRHPPLHDWVFCLVHSAFGLCRNSYKAKGARVVSESKDSEDEVEANLPLLRDVHLTKVLSTCFFNRAEVF